jgi:hypothetical protein
MYCIEIFNPSSIVRNFIISSVSCNYVNDINYIKKQNVHPFIQSNTDDYILIEFWTDDVKLIKDYIKFLNSQFLDYKITERGKNESLCNS